MTGSQDRSVTIYDTTIAADNTGGGSAASDSMKQVSKLCQVPKAHRYSIETAQWYPHDNGMFVTSGTDGVLKLWDANTMTPALEFSDFAGNMVYRHAMSPIASHALVAVAGSETKVKLCDPSSGAASHELAGHRDAVLAVAWSPTEE